MYYDCTSHFGQKLSNRCRICILPGRSANTALTRLCRRRQKREIAGVISVARSLRMSGASQSLAAWPAPSLVESPTTREPAVAYDKHCISPERQRLTCTFDHSGLFNFPASRLFALKLAASSRSRSARAMIPIVSSEDGTSTTVSSLAV